ncbi:uncharacterized protein [Setaria viridis]|uniref:uncharacterized protein n=1 Tax=Setaria viridis TaxID=4556 RepID=UPI003B3A7295
MEKHFRGFTIQQIPRLENDEADKLTKAAAQNEPLPPDVFYEIIQTPSTKEPASKATNAIQSFDWRAQIMAYMRGHFEPHDEVELTRLMQKARGYSIIDGELYKAGISTPWLRCIDTESGKEVLAEIHKGFCGSHIRSKALVSKVLRQGFYWPSVVRYAQSLVRGYEACQKLTNQGHAPSLPIQLIPQTWLL